MAILLTDLPAITALAEAYNRSVPTRRALKNADPQTLTVTVQIQGPSVSGAWQVPDAVLRKTLVDWAFEQAKQQTRDLKRDLADRGIDVSGDEDG